jgi:MFS family permease
LPTLTWTAYLLMACEGYLIYAVGFITPFLRSDLGAPPWLAALPNSALAVGLMLATPLVSRANARFGPRTAVRAWAGLQAVSAVLLAIPVSMMPVLAGALLLGGSIGGVLVHVNSALGEGRRGGTLLVRANLWSVAGGLLGPLVLASAATGIGWWVGLLAPVPFLALLALTLPPSPARDRPPVAGRRDRPLPREYWRSWLFLALFIGAEFSFVVWGAQVVAVRADISDVAATGLAALYVAGMVIGRVTLSMGLATDERRLILLRLGAVVAVAGATVTLLATTATMAGLGLLLGGLGISPAYPLGASVALSHAPGSPVRASARLTAASGVAIFSAPLGLGLVAGSVGVVGAWILVIGLLVAGLVVILRVPQPAAAPDGPAVG